MQHPALIQMRNDSPHLEAKAGATGSRIEFKEPNFTLCIVPTE